MEKCTIKYVFLKIIINKDIGLPKFKITKILHFDLEQYNILYSYNNKKLHLLTWLYIRRAFF